MSSVAAKLAVVAAGTALAVVASGCSVKEGANSDLVAGKKLFVQKCGSCHVLDRAGTKGTAGPNLDQAFHRDVVDGFGEAAIRGVVRQQIKIPAKGSEMPARLVEGQDAANVAAYVASVAAQPGKDEGLLATAVAPTTSSRPAVQVGGKITIPADPNGLLAFTFTSARGKAGEITLEMPNRSGVQHNIAVEGKGSSEIITSGASSFTASYAPGRYTYICEVTGHLAAGMKGTLTVE